MRIQVSENLRWFQAYEKYLEKEQYLKDVASPEAIENFRLAAGVKEDVKTPDIDPKDVSKEKIAKLNAEYSLLEAKQKRVLELAKANNIGLSEELSLELKLLKTKREKLNEELSILTPDDQAEIVEKKAEIYELDTNILLKEQEIARASNVWLATVHEIHSEIKSSSEAWTSLTKNAVTGLAGTISEGLVGLATGFPEQKQKAEELKVELESVKEQYKEAMGEGRIEDAKRLKDQMGELKDNIDDLEDPLHNVGEKFKEFFKGIIEKAQETIQELLAMEMVTWAIGGSKEQGSIGSGSGLLGSLWSGISGAVGSLWRGTGGVTPEIKSFRSFSSGGLTGSPTMAFLGDNPSNKELVIPSENISTNRVDGYAREKSSEEQPINIINVMTQEDVVQAMASAKGERLIVNMIGRDMNSRGPIWKQVKSS